MEKGFCKHFSNGVYNECCTLKCSCKRQTMGAYHLGCNKPIDVESQGDGDKFVKEEEND